MLTHHRLFSATAPANGYLRVKQADVAKTGEMVFTSCIPEWTGAAQLFRRLTVPPACCEMHQYYIHPITHCLLHSFQDEHKWRDALSVFPALSKNAAITQTEKLNQISSV